MRLLCLLFCHVWRFKFDLPGLMWRDFNSGGVRPRACHQCRRCMAIKEVIG